jgi:tol-pal system protein YbgF
MTRLHKPFRIAALAAQAFTIFACTLLASAASAQDRAQDRSSPGFLDNLFSRGESQQPQGESSVEYRRSNQGGRVAQADDPGEMAVRLDRIENTLRQLTGTLEQLQFRNQQLEQQVRALQSGGAATASQPQQQQPGARPSQSPNMPAYQPPAAAPGRRGDVYDPAQQPNAPGAPRTLGNQTSIAAPEPVDNGQPIGAPGGRDAGQPLDLSTMSGNPTIPPGTMANAYPDQSTLPPVVRQASQQPQAPPRVMNPPIQQQQPQQQLATLPPTASPQDEYDMAYGYILHKDYALAEQSFRDFLKKYPSERLVPDAQYWLGESMFQRQRYRDAAESFLAVSTKYEKAGKAPDSLLRLGQSLAALNQKEAACATLAEVERKFPKASASVKRGVTAEQKKAHC